MTAIRDTRSVPLASSFFLPASSARMFLRTCFSWSSSSGRIRSKQMRAGPLVVDATGSGVFVFLAMFFASSVKVRSRGIAWLEHGGKQLVRQCAMRIP